jgi:hypothetical protein
MIVPCNNHLESTWPLPMIVVHGAELIDIIMDGGESAKKMRILSHRGFITP